MRPGSAVVVGLVVLAGTRAVGAQGREFGAKAGPNFSSASVNQGADIYSRRVGIAGGGFAVLPVGHRLAVQIELLQMPKGAKLETGSSEGSTKLLLDYLDFPVLARVTAPGAAGVHVFGGPYLGFRVRAKTEYAQSAFSMHVGSREDVSSDVERTEGGVLAGAGMHIGRHGIVDARYAWGLTNVNRNTSDGLRIRHRVATVMIGVRF